MQFATMNKKTVKCGKFVNAIHDYNKKKSNFDHKFKQEVKKNEFYL